MSYQPPVYLTPAHPDAFVDWPVMQPTAAFTKPCHVCKCHGGWNLTLNAYPLHHYTNTPENRHRYSHFRKVCNHCNGYGYVHPDNNCPGHEWVHTRNVGRCLDEYKCKHCPAIAQFDSGD